MRLRHCALFLMGCFGAFALSTWAQVSRVSRQFTYNVPQHEVVVPSDRVVRVYLSELPTGKEWAFGVRSVPGIPQATLQAGFILFENMRGIRFPLTIESVDASLVEIGPAGVRLNRLDSVAGSLLVFLTVPPGTILDLSTNQGPILRSQVGSGFIVRNGEILPEVPQRLGSLWPRLIAPRSAQPDVPQRLPNGKHSVSGRLLRANALQTKLPEYPNAARVAGTEGVVIAMVEVDARGSVSNMRAFPSDPLLAAAVDEALKQWKFDPFLVQGNAVSVVGPLAFEFRHGKVTWLGQ